jgi:4-diphosphocytidyl-2-C-methyl-D-erythritol kinase
MPEITELARAKVNLTLRVRGRRPDGYHHLESLIVFAADAADIVHFTPGAPRRVHVSGPQAGAIVGTNLIDKALDRLAAAEPGLTLGEVHLEKHLPVAAGVGGGSSDAAALLRAVRRANPAAAGTVDWDAIAAELGADVPVCLANTAALVWGTGADMRALPDLPVLSAVLVNPMSPVPADKTAQVFARLGAEELSRTPPAPGLPAAADRQALVAYARAQGNDLMPAASAVVPQIAAVHALLTANARCLAAGLSGAGPTCFGLYARPEEATAAAAEVVRRQPGWWVAASALGS